MSYPSYKTKEGLTILKIPAKHISYGGTRSLDNVRYIVIHYTGNNGDTAVGNCNYFKNSNARAAGAHFFVDASGVAARSIDMHYTAWSVGGFFTRAGGAGKYYNKCLNSNSVSIELCNYTRGYITGKQLASVIKLIKYIMRKCPNVKTIIRHWDVNGKCCPAAMVGKSNKNWKTFKKDLKAAGIKGVKFG